MGDSSDKAAQAVAALTVTPSNATEHKRAAETEDEPAKRPPRK